MSESKQPSSAGAGAGAGRSASSTEAASSPPPATTGSGTQPASASASTRGRDAAALAAAVAEDANEATATPVAKKDKQPSVSCPTCGGTLEKYAGTAAHKLGSYFCRACGVRHRLSARAAADDGAALTRESTSSTKAAG